jgi:serine/threonine-protein kinase HipA
MAASLTNRRKAAFSALRAELDVCIGKAGLLAGRLNYTKDGPREFSAFAYDDAWLNDAERFEISPDLEFGPGFQVHRPPTQDDSCFFFALADTEPEAWGRRVIARVHAKERRKDPSQRALTELDYLCAVDDFSRVGALRLRETGGRFLRTVEEGKRATAPILELAHIMQASRAVELSQETSEDLKYLQGKGTSLGGLRPKCTVLDEDATLAIGKFASVHDERSVTRGEALALRLARLAGIETADARIVLVEGTPVVVIRRFDRTPDQGRIPYLSGASMLLARRNDERAYTELVDAIASRCLAAAADARQLWRRLLFNLLITNVDDHLQNIGFLHVAKGLWRLAPAFDLNPFPDKDRESKTWLSEDSGPITSVQDLLDNADRFFLDRSGALQSLGVVHAALSKWRQVAASADVGMTPAQVEDFASAFEHPESEAARKLLAIG